MRARRTRKDVRQAQIAQAVLRVVGARSAGGLSIAAVAAAVGLVPSGLYRHYAGKDALLDAAVAYLDARVTGLLTAAAQAKAAPLEALDGVLEALLALREECPALPRLLATEDLVGGSEARRATLERLLGRCLAALAQRVRACQKAGILGDACGPADAARLLLGVVQSTLFFPVTPGGVEAAAAYARSAWGLVRRGLTVAPAEPVRPAAGTSVSRGRPPVAGAAAAKKPVKARPAPPLAGGASASGCNPAPRSAGLSEAQRPVVLRTQPDCPLTTALAFGEGGATGQTPPSARSQVRPLAGSAKRQRKTLPPAPVRKSSSASASRKKLPVAR